MHAKFGACMTIWKIVSFICPTMKQETVSGSSISWTICKSAPRSRQTTTPAPHHSVFYRPDALPAAQPTASKHWRQSNVPLLLFHSHCIHIWIFYPLTKTIFYPIPQVLAVGKIEWQNCHSWCQERAPGEGNELPGRFFAKLSAPHADWLTPASSHTCSQGYRTMGTSLCCLTQQLLEV